MKLIDWIKKKLNSPQEMHINNDLFTILTVTIVAPSDEQPSPVVESEILAEQPLHISSPLLASPSRPQTTCFPELAVLLYDHRNWLKKIKQIMCENKSCDYSPATVGTQLMSEIGKWLQGEGKQLAIFPEYQALEKAHTQFNRCAGTILVQHQRGEFLDAINMLHHDFMQNSAQVESTLTALLIRARHDYCPDCTAHNDEIMVSVAA